MPILPITCETNNRRECPNAQFSSVWSVILSLCLACIKMIKVFLLFFAEITWKVQQSDYIVLMVLSWYGRRHDDVFVVFFLAISLCHRCHPSKMKFGKKQRGRFLLSVLIVLKRVYRQFTISIFFLFYPNHYIKIVFFIDLRYMQWKTI